MLDDVDLVLGEAIRRATDEPMSEVQAQWMAELIRNELANAGVELVDTRPNEWSDVDDDGTIVP